MSTESGFNQLNKWKPSTDPRIPRGSYLGRKQEITGKFGQPTCQLSQVPILPVVSLSGPVPTVSPRMLFPQHSFNIVEQVLFMMNPFEQAFQIFCFCILSTLNKTKKANFISDKSRNVYSQGSKLFSDIS